MMIDSLQQFLQRFASIFRRGRLDRELDAELSAHIELATEENLERGMSAGEARRQALIHIGGTQQARERHREARGLHALDLFFQDLRYALRGLVKSPGFASAAVLTLALGIAVNATMFSMVSGFLLRRPPVRQPEHVVVVSSVSPAGGLYADTNLISVPNYLAWRAGNDVFDGVAAVDLNRTVNLTLKAQTQALPAAAISANYFSVLGVHPQLGRGFSEEETQPGR
ncbi:MAG: permease prefix domain 1-containing protein, partial [Actinomycetota bacterium]